MAAMPFQHGDPAAIQQFALLTQASADSMTGVRSKRSGFVHGALASGFRGQGGTAAQAVNADFLDPNGAKLETRQQKNGDNVSMAGRAYESSDMDYGRNMNTVTAASDGGSIGGAINPPTA